MASAFDDPEGVEFVWHLVLGIWNFKTTDLNDQTGQGTWNNSSTESQLIMAHLALLDKKL